MTKTEKKDEESPPDDGIFFEDKKLRTPQFLPSLWRKNSNCGITNGGKNG
jgi:hypothetical protein